MAEPRPGFDIRIDTRLMPDGNLGRFDLQPGKRHEIVTHVPGGEEPGATVPEAGKASAGMAMAKVGEKWSTSAPTGAGGVSLALPLPIARGLTPQVAIAYSTAGGNGPFGWGWRGPVPYFVRTSTKALLREHGRGLPEYDDAGESDVFQFSDADELVKIGEGIDAASGAVVVTYRARTEGSFARIERHEVGGRSHFVVRSADDVLSIFGRDPEACVSDPEDPTRVFQWFLQEQRDDRGNVAVYRYKAEDLVGVDPQDGAERNRGGPQPQRYLARILYGNRDVPGDANIELASLDAPGARARFMFEVVFDYGERGDDPDADHGWPVRRDPFSGARAGFEIRTRRLCRRVLVFHRFAQLGPAPVLVRTLRFGYDESAAVSLLVSAQLTGHGEERTTTLPARTFAYSPRSFTATTREIAVDDLDLSQPRVDAELFDLDGNGRSGLLTREAGRFVFRPGGDRPGTFAPAATIPFGATPSDDPAAHLQRWLDVAGTGQPALVEFGPSDAVVFARADDGIGWRAGAAVPASKTPPVGEDPIAERHRIYLLDLDGDGICDVLVAREGEYAWWRRMGESLDAGWQQQPAIAHDGDEERGPGPVLFDAERDLAPEGTPRTEAIVIADMTGDGLPDIVRIRADEIAYWPNLGYGRFGGKVVIGTGAGGPVDPIQVRVFDIDTLGPSDLVILDRAGGGRVLLNESGNRLVAGPSFATAPLDELALSSLGRIDGACTGAFAWAPKTDAPTLTVVDFMATRPGMLVRDDSGTGLRTTIRHGTSTEHAMRASAAGTPWRTRLPLAVSVVDGVVVEDLVRGTRFSSSYRYAHGHYDPREREFRGFAFVEQIDEDAGGGARDSAYQTSEDAQPAMRVCTWFWNGSGVDLGDEYNRFDAQAKILPAPDLGAGDPHEAARALRGATLRSESYSDAPGPDPGAASRPLVTTTHAWSVREVAAKGGGHHASVLPIAEQTLTYTYEREATPDPRLVHTAVLELDDLGFATRTATVAYPRRKGVPDPPVIPPKGDPDGPGSILLRLVGLAFDTDKSFVLPSAMAGLVVLKAQFAAAGTGGEVLVIGHTDRVGTAEANLGISLQRARRVVELLRHDVDGWMALYESSIPASIRWGAHEDAVMLAAIGFAGDVAGFQGSVDGLVVDGALGPATRGALVRRYMERAGPPVSEGLIVRAIGAGEAFPIDDTEAAAAINRRTEIFFFSDGIDPPAPEKFLVPDDPAYAVWISRVTQRADVALESGSVSEIDGALVGAPAPEPRPDAAVPRMPTDDPQLRTVFVVSESDLVHQQEADVHRLGTAVETRTFEVTGKPGDPRSPMSLAQLRQAASGGAVIPFEQTPSGAHERRLVGRSRVYFYDDALRDPGPLGAVGKRALPAKSLVMAFTDAQAAEILGPMMIAARGDDPTKVLRAGGYLHEDGAWWVPSSRTVFSAAQFYQPIATIDPFGHRTQTITYDRDHYLVVRQVTYPTDNAPLMSSVAYEYRSFGARGSFDPNGSATIRHFDGLGRVISEVRRGDPAGKEIDAPEDERDVRGSAYGSEGDDDDSPTIVYTYDDDAFVTRGAPLSVTRVAKIEYGARDLSLALDVTYLDGAGAELQTKTRTEGGKFRASGRTVVNDKGLPVATYAAFISGGAGFDPGASQLLARMRYDGLGRLVRTDAMDGTHERIEIGAWESTAYDRNDTVLESDWLTAQPAGIAAATVAHANTPTTTRLDVLGRPVAVFARYRDEDGRDVVIATRQQLDVSGNVIEVVDARGNVAERRAFGMLGQLLRVESVDAGESRAIADVVGAPLRAVDARGNVFAVDYDRLRRPIEEWVVPPGQAPVLVTKRVFGDGENEAASLGGRRRGRLVRVYDGGGETRIDTYDLDGHATKVSRRIVDLPRMLAMAQAEGRPPRARMDWEALGGITDLAGIDAMLPVLGVFEDKAHTTTSRFDARGRVVETRLPLSGSTHRTSYTEDGLVQRIDRETAAGTHERVYEAKDFDHLGRPLQVVHGEAARTSFTYDPVTERLLRLQSHGGGRSLQALEYGYDAMGNILQVRDGAQATVYRDNAALEAVNDYRYDALYRLVEATGREHEGQAANGRTPRSGDAPVVPLRSVSPNDPKAMRRYTQRYRYDAVGNVVSLQHFAGAGSFRRAYAYSEHGNRLLATGNAAEALSERYAYDVAGHMVAMPHLQKLVWNELDELELVQRGTQQVWLQYAGGVRVRKLVRSGEGVVEDRVYLGGEEMYTKRRGGAVVEQTLTEHVGGGLQVDIKLVADGKAIAKPVALQRYALADHLGSVKLEVDAEGKVIAYEEFHPYGTTSYRAMRSGLDASANRYRFTGMERDEETGLAQHGARYYAGWLGRWVSADPIGVAGGINCYAYCDGDPVGLTDTSGAAPTTVRVKAPPCDAECRSNVIESYKAARSSLRDEYMNDYAEWMRGSGSMSREEDAAARRSLREKYSQWQSYGDAIASMYSREREFEETERAAGGIVASKRMIAAAAIVGTSAALGLTIGSLGFGALKEAGAGWLLSSALSGAGGGAVEGMLSSGGLALLEGASLSGAAEAAQKGAVTGAVVGGLTGYFGGRFLQRFAPSLVGDAMAVTEATREPIFKPNTIVKSNAKVYHVIGAADHSLYAHAKLNGRELWLNFRVRYIDSSGAEIRGVLRGREQFDAAVRHFAGRFDRIRGIWSSGDNLAAMQGGAAPHQTWTGQQAARHGYTSARIVDHVYLPGTDDGVGGGTYSYVEVLFSRP